MAERPIPPAEPESETADCGGYDRVGHDESGAWWLRGFVIAASLGLLLAILVSLWTLHDRVGPTAVIWTDDTWVYGDRAALRVQVRNADAEWMAMRSVHAFLESTTGNVDALDFGPLEIVRAGKVAQATLRVPRQASIPDAEAGTLRLEIEVEDEGGARRLDPQRLPLRIASQAPIREPTIARPDPVLQRGDDSEPQPETLRIDVFPAGRLLAGFVNRLYIRVTDSDGRPHAGPDAKDAKEISVRLIAGELAGQKGHESDAPTLYRGSLDDLGLAMVEGELHSSVCRLRIDVHPRQSDAIVARRMIRLVSFSGGTRLLIAPNVLRAGDKVALIAQSLSSRSDVFVDIHDEAGSWHATLSPPLVPGRQARIWPVADMRPGLHQLEAYTSSQADVATSDIARLWILEDAQSPQEALAALASRAEIGAGNSASGHDLGYLRFLAQAKLDASQAERGLEWLLGTMPIRIFGTKAHHDLHERANAELRERKSRWTAGLRWLLYGGGGTLLLALGWLFVRQYRTTRDRTQQVLEEASQGDGGVMRNPKELLARGIAMLLVLLAALILTGTLLERFLRL